MAAPRAASDEHAHGESDGGTPGTSGLPAEAAFSGMLQAKNDLAVAVSAVNDCVRLMSAAERQRLTRKAHTNPASQWRYAESPRLKSAVKGRDSRKAAGKAKKAAGKRPKKFTKVEWRSAEAAKAAIATVTAARAIKYKKVTESVKLWGRMPTQAHLFVNQQLSALPGQRTVRDTRLVIKAAWYRINDASLKWSTLHIMLGIGWARGDFGKAMKIIMRNYENMAIVTEHVQEQQRAVDTVSEAAISAAQKPPRARPR